MCVPYRGVCVIEWVFLMEECVLLNVCYCIVSLSLIDGMCLSRNCDFFQNLNLDHVQKRTNQLLCTTQHILLLLCYYHYCYPSILISCPVCTCIGDIN